MDSNDKHRADVDISSVENLLFVLGFAFSDVATSPLYGASRFTRKDKWVYFENINVEPKPLMSMILIHNIWKG